MEIFLLFVALVQSFGVSLGVGASTIAIMNYVIASRNESIDESERALLKGVFRILRVAMGIILITLFIQGLALVPIYGTAYLSSFIVFVWFVVIVLYANAIMMTKHLMPRALGPGLQAGSWYALGILYFFANLGIVYFSYTQLFAGYVALLAVMIVAVNGALAFFRTKV